MKQTRHRPFNPVTLAIFGGKHTKIAAPINAELLREERGWGVKVFLRSCHCDHNSVNRVLGAVSNGGKEAMDLGLEDEETWTNIPARAYDGKKEYTFFLYIWRALKSHWKELRQATDEEKKIIWGIIDIIREIEKKEVEPLSNEVQQKYWSYERWSDEMAEHMDRTQELKNWKHIVVQRCFAFFSSEYHSVLGTTSGLYLFISFQS